MCKYSDHDNILHSNQRLEATLFIIEILKMINCKNMFDYIRVFQHHILHQFSIVNPLQSLKESTGSLHLSTSTCKASSVCTNHYMCLRPI